jgi:hypothetical protein
MEEESSTSPEKQVCVIGFLSARHLTCFSGYGRNFGIFAIRKEDL